MLVVTRTTSEKVVIGDPKNPIGTVMIASVKGERVRIAFDFPKDVPVNREEIAAGVLAGKQWPPTRRPRSTQQERLQYLSTLDKSRDYRIFDVIEDMRAKGYFAPSTYWRDVRPSTRILCEAAGVKIREEAPT